MTFETFSPEGLQQFTDALIALSYGQFSVVGLDVFLDEELSESEFELLIAECGYEHIFTLG